MPGYETVLLDVPVGTHSFRLKTLRDRQQYADPHGHAARSGISCASWPYFGWLWPAAIVLAEAMNEIDVEGRLILEIGCGLGLPSLVLKRNGANITASDYHPLAESFLDENAALNGMSPIDFVDLHWGEQTADLGRFDVIIGSDILYERGQAELLAKLIHRHSAPCAEVWISCPGRGYVGRFNRALHAQGFDITEMMPPVEAGEPARRRRERLFRYRRCRDSRRPLPIPSRTDRIAVGGAEHWRRNGAATFGLTPRTASPPGSALPDRPCTPRLAAAARRSRGRAGVGGMISPCESSTSNRAGICMAAPRRFAISSPVSRTPVSTTCSSARRAGVSRRSRPRRSAARASSRCRCAATSTSACRRACAACSAR